MYVEDVMTPHPVTTTVSARVEEALALLDRYRVTSLPVVDETGRIQGVVSEADLIRERVPNVDPEKQDAPLDPLPLVGDVYTPHAVVARPHDELADAVDLMTSTTVKSLPVVDRRGVVVGVVSRSDVVHFLAGS